MATINLRSPFNSSRSIDYFERCDGWIVQSRTRSGKWAWFNKLTFAGTRSGAIQKYTDHRKSGDDKFFSFHGGPNRRNAFYDTPDKLWRAERRAGLVRCVRVEIIPSTRNEFDRDEITILMDVERRIMERLRCCDPKRTEIANLSKAFSELSEAIGAVAGIDPIDEIMFSDDGG